VAHAVRVLRDVASALAYAHEQGVAHRDIKPDNVLLSHGVAVVTDFGVAKALATSSAPNAVSGPGLTSLGVTLGTPHYMAPEQGTADPGMDHRVDIYAFGAMAYELLTGEPPFTGKSAHAILGAHLAAIPRPITIQRPGVPPLLGLVIMKCLEKRPADRPQSADEVISALDSLTTPTAGTVAIPALMRQARTARVKEAVRRFLLPATVVALAATVAFLLWPRRGQMASTVGTAPESLAAPPPAAVPTPQPVAPAPAPAPAAVETVTPPPAPVRRSEPPPARRPEPAAPAVSADDSALLVRLRAEAAGARARAVAAGTAESLLARGDSSVARAESLAARRRIAQAAVQLSGATTLWSEAAAAPPEPAAPPAASAPPVEPPPAPVPSRDSAPAPAPNPAQQIRDLFAQYEAALEAKSVEAIRRTYPGLQAAQAREWEEFFRNVDDVEVELNVTGLRVGGNAAEAYLAGVYVFTNPGNGRTQRETVGFRAALQREGGNWKIASLL
jgi:hypothetical protein